MQTKKPRVSSLFHKISKKVGMAVADYDLLHDNDKILVGVSGGKDSLLLLELLKYRQTFAPIHFEITAAHIDFGLLGNKKLDKLKKFFEKKNIPYHIEKVDILKGKSWSEINCFWCSWNRRKALFQMAHRLGMKKIALAHHMDDIAETILLNLFYQGHISAMKPKQEFFDGKLTIIRPLAYVEEHEIIRLVKKMPSVDVVGFKCPQGKTSRRALMKTLVKELQKDSRQIKKNIFKSVQRIREDYLL